jgi:hypothetical protein
MSCGPVATLTMLSLAVSANAGWLPSGNPLTQDGADQAYPVLAADERGTTIAWQEFGRIFAQRLTRTGEVASGWPAGSGLEVCPDGPVGPYMQSSVRVAPDDSGGVYVLWHDERRSGCQSFCFDQLRELYLEHLDENGARHRGWPSDGTPVGSAQWYMGFTTGTRRVRPSDFNTVVTPDGAGGLLIAWEEGPPFSGDSTNTIRAQRVSPDGRLLWGPRGVLVREGPGSHCFPTIASDASGGALVAWEESSGSGGGQILYGQRLGVSGQLLWAQNGAQLAQDTTHTEQTYMATGDGRGGLFVAWQAAVDSSSRVFAQRIRGNGGTAWPADISMAGTAGNQTTPSICADHTGGAWLAWLDSRSGTSLDVYAQRLLGDGSTNVGWPPAGAPVCVVPRSVRWNPTIRVARTNEAYVAWFDSTFSPRATRVSPQGSVTDGWPSDGLHLSDSEYGNYQLQLEIDEAGGAFVMWDEGRLPTGNLSLVLAQHLCSTGIGLDPSGDSLADYAGISKVTFLPNPSREELTLAVVVPTDGPARLELFDLGGRRLLDREVGSLSRGRHMISLGPSGALPTGFYFVKLICGSKQVSSRGVVVH